MDGTRQTNRSTPEAGPRFSDAAEVYLAEVRLRGKFRSSDTATRALNRINEILGDPSLESIGRGHVRRLKDALREQDLASTTVNGFLKYFKATLRSAQAEGLVDQVPKVTMLPEDRPDTHALTADEMAHLLDANPGAPWHTMLSVLLYTGIRISELIHLDWSDLKPDGRLTITPKPCTCCGGKRWSPKSHQRRAIQLDAAPDVILLLQQHRERETQRTGRRPGPDDPIFPPHHSRSTRNRWAQSKLSKHITACFRRARLRGSAHTLRRTHATLSKACGVDLDTIRRNLGHSTLAITEKYFAADEHEQRRAIAGIHEALNRSRDAA